MGAPGWIQLSPEQRFFRNTIKEDSCWIWIGGKSRSGYGRFSVRGKQVFAHRFSYSRFKGEIPPSLFVCHACDRPACVNPDHLWLGTNTDNMRDASNKGRMCSGENNRATKLTRDQAQEILDNPHLSASYFVEKFGIERSTPYAIRKGKSWKYLKRGERG